MKIVVVGARGMLGRKIVEVFSPHHDVHALGRRSDEFAVGLDLLDFDAVRRVLAEQRPDVVVNAAAFTAVDDCETRRDDAFRGNAVAPANLAQACREIDCAMLHVSTDYVFDGEKGAAYEEWDEPAPRSVYGWSKLAGERAVVASGARHWICRLQWLYGEGGRNFAATILGLSRRQPMLRVVDDQIGAPTYTGDVAREMLRLVEAGRFGLYHISAGGETTWWGFARALLDAVGRRDYLIERCKTSEYPRPALRPRNSKLANRMLELTIGDRMRPWRDAVDDYLHASGESAS